jgi:hypothetical protein
MSPNVGKIFQGLGPISVLNLHTTVDDGPVLKVKQPYYVRKIIQVGLSRLMQAAGYP